MIASVRFQVIPRNVTGWSQPIDSPKSPKNSPYRNPKMMEGIEEIMRMSERLAINCKFLNRFLRARAKKNMINPYPMSPTMIPKKIGKKIARIGDGSTSRYRGGETSCMINSKGFTHHGLS